MTIDLQTLSHISYNHLMYVQLNTYKLNRLTQIWEFVFSEEFFVIFLTTLAQIFM
jgi:hypothetical protein